jgi:hypothetical protein
MSNPLVDRTGQLLAVIELRVQSPEPSSSDTFALYPAMMLRLPSSL